MTQVWYNSHMRDNKLTIQINKPIAEVFAFTLDPKNTPRWIDDSSREETNEWPPKPGTIYKNTGKNGVVLTFIMTEIVPNDHFSMKDEDNNYHCIFSFRNLGNNSSEFEWHEWMETGELELPMTQDVLEKLKSVLENRQSSA